MKDGNEFIELWSNRFDDYSYNNPTFGLSALHLLTGQLLKFQHIRKRGQLIDGRCNVYGMMDTGSGKSVALDMVDPYCRKLGISIMSIGDLTDAALLGTIEPEIKYNEYNDKEVDYVEKEGILKDADIIHFDEGERLLSSNKNSENMKLYFQQGMNPIGTPSNIIRKKLAHGDIMEIPVSGSFYFTSYVPLKFESMIINSGLLPRMLMVPKELSYQDRLNNSNRDLDNLGEEDTDHHWMDKELMSGFKQIKSAGQQDLEFDFSRVKPKLRSIVTKMYDIFGQSSYTTQKIMYGFVPRYQNILYTLSMHHAVIDDRINIKPADVGYAYSQLIEPALKNMLTLVEVTTTQPKKGEEEEKITLRLAMIEYEKMKSDENGGWVGIKRLSKTLGSAMHKSEGTGRRYLKILLEKDHFESLESGNTLLVRPTIREEE